MSASALNLRPAPPAGRAVRNCRSVGAPAAQPGASSRKVYLALLTWAFTLFNSVRVFSYLPTLWAIHATGNSSQHSLITWLTWLGANVTMALWLYEHNGQRCNRAVMVNAVNALMCLVTSLLIVWHRF